MKPKRIAATLALGGFLAAALLTPTPSLAQTKNDPLTGKKPSDSSVLDYVDSGYTFAASIGGLVAVIMLIYAGYRYITSYGNPENISEAKDIVEKTLIGLALLVLAAVILNSINPATTQTCTPGTPGCGEVDFSKPKGK
jgi:type IV secretion system pilin